MYTQQNIYIHVCTTKYIYTCIVLYTQVNILYVHIYMQLDICIHMYTQVSILYIHIYMQLYIYILKYTQVNMCIHTHVYATRL